MRLAIDGHLLLDPIVEASLEPLDAAAPDPWVSTLLRLRLAPGHLPSPFLTTLCQTRPARRLVVELDGGVVWLEELGTASASIVAPSDALFEDPRPDRPGLALEFALVSRPPVVDARAFDLEPFPWPSADELHDPGPPWRSMLGRDMIEKLSHFSWSYRGNSYVFVDEEPPRDPAGWEDFLTKLGPEYKHHLRQARSLEVVTFSFEREDEASMTAQLRAGVERWRDARPQFAGYEVDAHAHGIDGLLAFDRAKDEAAGLRRLGPARWLKYALDRRRADQPFTAKLADALDRHGVESRADWSVFADHLQAQGDVRGTVLAQVLADQDPFARDDDAVLAVLSASERLIYEVTRTPGGRLASPKREWSPRLWGRWVGPFLVQLAVEPGWTRVVDDDGMTFEEISIFSSKLDLDSYLRRRPQRAGESLGVRSWQTLPGFWALPELERMFELPCCAVLSPRRILFAGEWRGFSGPVNFAGADLRGIVLAGACLRDCDFCGANLAGARFETVLWYDCDFRGADLSDGTMIKHVGFVNSDLRGVRIERLKLGEVRAHNSRVDPRLQAILDASQHGSTPRD